MRARRIGILIGAVSVAAIVLVAVGPHLVLARMRTPIARTPEVLGLSYDTVEFPSGGDGPPVSIEAWWLAPETPRAAVLLVHGGSSNKSSPWMQGLEIARDLNALGYAVLLPDLRNHGRSGSSPAGRVTFGRDEADDLLGALDHLERTVPELPVVAVGFSMGGSTLLHAAARDERILAGVTVGTPDDFHEPLVRAVRATMPLPGFLIRWVVWSGERQGVLSLPRSVGRTNAAVAGRPWLVVHNESDPIVPVEHAHALVEAIPEARLWITRRPADDHPLWAESGAWGMHVRSYPLDPEGFVERVTAVFDEALGAPAEPDGPADPTS